MKSFFLYILFKFNLGSIEDWSIFFSTLSNNNNGMKKTVNNDVIMINIDV